MTLRYYWDYRSRNRYEQSDREKQRDPGVSDHQSDRNYGSIFHAYL